MFADRIRALFGQAEIHGPDTTSGGIVWDPLHLAACALLLDIAYADGEFSPLERGHIERSLERHFALTTEAVRQVMDLAEEERKSAVDHFAFTSTLLKGYDTGQKLVLAEVMWGVALADGHVAEHEHYLTRKIANLLNLEPGYLSAAKQAAATRLTPPG
ncbi:MAG: TerB family tellurite resistance protein, partial [Gemmatimonadaceae bacterium]